MKLYNIRSGSYDSLESKEYNIGVGISIGNKWFTPENIVAAIKWALAYTRKNVVVYVADTIHGINIEVRKGFSREKAKEKAKKLGAKTLQEVKELAELTFTQKEERNIRYAVWGDMVTDKYQAKVNYLYAQYEINQKFHDVINSLVCGFIKKEEREFSQEQIEKLGTYILEEMPELLERVPIKDEVYDAYVYPFDGELNRFLEQLQNKEIFAEIADEIIETAPKVFLEVR